MSHITLTVIRNSTCRTLVCTSLYRVSQGLCFLNGNSGTDMFSLVREINPLFDLTPSKELHFGLHEKLGFVRGNIKGTCKRSTYLFSNNKLIPSSPRTEQTSYYNMKDTEISLLVVPAISGYTNKHLDKKTFQREIDGVLNRTLLKTPSLEDLLLCSEPFKVLIKFLLYLSKNKLNLVNRG